MLHLIVAGAQAQAARETQTKVEDPESPQGPDKGPATKRQHLIVMRHGERIDEVGRLHCSAHGGRSGYGVKLLDRLVTFQHCLVMRHGKRIDEVSQV